MPSTRRRFLAGVTALTGGLAGCNESTSDAVRETVTPVEVPRTDREILREAAGIEVPTFPPAVVVSDAHLKSAIGQLERLRDSLVEAAESREEPGQHEEWVARGRSPEDTVDYVEERIDRARGMGPSREALETVRDALHDAATGVGYLRAEAGDLTTSDVEAALEAEQSAVDAVRDGMEYRVDAPVAENLPTVHRAEEILRRLRGGVGPGVRPADGDDVATDAAASEPPPTPMPEPGPRDVAERYHRLERVRRTRDDVEQFLETATDEGARSLRADLERNLADVRSELEPIAADYRGEEGQGGGGSLAEEIRGIRRSVGGRADRHLATTPASPPDGDLVRVLVEGVRRLVSFHSVDVGVERTLERLDGRQFPTAALLEEKRRAVEHVEAAAGAPALGRTFAETAPQLLGRRTGIDGDDAQGVERIARLHVYYVSGGEWARRGVARADGLSESL